MTFGALLQPDLILGDCILALTPETIVQHGLRGLILDVDDTLVPTTTDSVSPELVKWVEAMRPEVQLWLASNNLSEARIGSIARTLSLPYFIGAAKPSRRKLRQALQEMQLPPERVAMVGDRLFTDVLAGNRLGLFTVLVQPMVNPLESARSYPIHALEVWLSKLVGASFYRDPSPLSPPESSGPV